MRDSNTLISLQIPKELLADIKEISQTQSLSVAAYIRLLLMEDVKNRDVAKASKNK